MRILIRALIIILVCLGITMAIRAIDPATGPDPMEDAAYLEGAERQEFIGYIGAGLQSEKDRQRYEELRDLARSRRGE